MAEDDFAQRLDGIRKRFAGRLPARLADIDASLPLIGAAETGVAAAVYSTHRMVHDLCGIGPTLGFHETGKAARVCERVLLHPSREQRGLTEQELAHLKEGLVTLRAAAADDMKSTGVVAE